MTTSTSQPITVDQADTVHAVTKAICRRLRRRADDLKMLPSTRRDLAAIVDGTAPRYVTYMTFGEIDDRGYERTKVTLRLDFDRVEGLGDRDHMTVVGCDGARYMVQRLRIYVEMSQQSYSATDLALHIARLQTLLGVVLDIEAQFGGRDLYLLLASAEEVREKETQRQRATLSQLITSEISGLRVGQSRQIVCDVATRLPGIVWPSLFLGIETQDRRKVARIYDVSVGNVAVMVTRTQ